MHAHGAVNVRLCSRSRRALATHALQLPAHPGIRFGVKAVAETVKRNGVEPELGVDPLTDSRLPYRWLVSVKIVVAFFATISCHQAHSPDDTTVVISRRSGLSTTVSIGSQLRVVLDHRSGRARLALS